MLRISYLTALKVQGHPLVTPRKKLGVNPNSATVSLPFGSGAGWRDYLRRVLQSAVPQRLFDPRPLHLGSAHRRGGAESLAVESLVGWGFDVSLLQTCLLESISVPFELIFKKNLCHGY